MYTLGILIDDFFTNSASYSHQPAFVIQKISNYLGIYTMLTFLEALVEFVRKLGFLAFVTIMQKGFLPFKI